MLNLRDVTELKTNLVAKEKMEFDKKINLALAN